MNYFMLAALPLIAVFAVSVAIGNTYIVYKKGFAKADFFEISLSLFLFATAATYFLFLHNGGSPLQEGFAAAFNGVAFYTEAAVCVTAVSAFSTARKKPQGKKDFIIVLGCATAKDGKPLPLLQRRTDAAAKFYYEQLKKTGKKAIIIASGGQEFKNTPSEAAAIRDYLISKGVAFEQIITEDKSKSTYQNMLFSKEIVDKIQPKAFCAVSTTDYHLLRSLKIAKRLGLNCEGISSKSRLFSLPASFVRETAALIFMDKKRQTCLLAASVCLFVVLSLLF